jgi:hypothetical protein
MAAHPISILSSGVRRRVARNNQKTRSHLVNTREKEIFDTALNSWRSFVLDQGTRPGFFVCYASTCI